MSQRIRFTPDAGRLSGDLSEAPVFPDGDFFHLSIPEVIGDASQVSVTTDLPAIWADLGGGRWGTTGQFPGELDFAMTVTPGYDSVDIDVSVTNRSSRLWAQTLAFHCFSCQASTLLADFECSRHWARNGQLFQRLVEIPRRFSPRPTVQAYNVEGAPPVTQVPFIDAFQATPGGVVLEDWLAVVSRDGLRLAAVVSQPALFLFQNMEYSCIHSGPSFGPLGPGQTGSALTRVYLARGPLEDWHRRMRSELAG